jgi:hypothetical protein
MRNGLLWSNPSLLLLGHPPNLVCIQFGGLLLASGREVVTPVCVRRRAIAGERPQHGSPLVVHAGEGVKVGRGNGSDAAEGTRYHVCLTTAPEP